MKREYVDRFTRLVIALALTRFVLLPLLAITVVAASAWWWLS